MATVSRLILAHPALGTTGGASLHTAVEALYQKIGDAIATRWYQLTDFDQTETVDLEHNFDTDIANLRYDIYVFTGGLWVRLSDDTSPLRSAFTIIEKVGFEDTVLQITNNTGGNDLLAAVVVTNDPISLEDGDVTDVDISSSAPQDGQALVYEASSDKWKPGASGDASFKLQAVSTPTLTLKGGSIIDGDDEYSTYDGAGALASDYGVDLALNLTTIFGGAPANDTTYFLFIDKYTLGSEQVVQFESGDSTGRQVYQVVQANFVLSTTRHRDGNRYVYIGFVKSATTGNAWSGSGATFGTEPFRRHDSLTRFFSYSETFVDATIATAAALNTLTHNLSGEPHALYLTYDDGSTEIGLDLSAHLLDVTATQIKVSSLGLTFSGAQRLRVRAVRFPQQQSLAAQSRSFVSAWFTSTATTTLPHGLNDVEDIKGYSLEEWDVTAGRYRLMDPSALVVNFDATNFYLNWTGLSPSGTLQYRLIVGGSPLPYSIPLEIGGYTKFVGTGPGSYATLTAAVAASAAGDSIYVARSTTEPAGDLSIGVADLRVTCKKGAIVGLNGALTNGLRLTAARIDLKEFALSLAPSGAQARGISVEAADCKVEGRIDYAVAQTLTDAFHVTSGGVRAFARLGVNRTAGTITNLETNNDGAGSTVIWGG